MSVAYELLGSVLKYKFMAFEEAMQCYEKAIDDEYKPPSIDGKQWASRKCKICGEMATSHDRAMHDMLKAEECFKRGLEFCKHHFGVYEDYADFLRSCGRINEAVALYEKVVPEDDEQRRLLEGSSILFVKNFIRPVHVATVCMCEGCLDCECPCSPAAASMLCLICSGIVRGCFRLSVATGQKETNCR